MNRFQRIWQRYNWQTPFVVLSIIIVRSRKLSTLIHLNWLRLTTSGLKGRNIELGSNVTITPGSHLVIGNGVFIGARCIFEIMIEPRGKIKIGDNSWISHDCHLASWSNIEIGSCVLIGEFVSIRDSTHSYDLLDKPIKFQQDKLGTVVIQDNVWIGRGCLLQGKPEGIVIGQGTIIAANSMVNCNVPTNQIWGGNPARYIKNRVALK